MTARTQPLAIDLFCGLGGWTEGLLAEGYRVVGFDIAGAEAGFPPSRHQDAFDYIRGESCHITIHAGEAFGLPSIHEAVAFCGCERLGPGVRIVDDIEVHTGYSHG